MVALMHIASNSCRRWLACTQVYIELGYTHAYTFTHTDVHSPTHALTHTHVHTYICIHWHLQTHTHPHTHTRAPSSVRDRVVSLLFIGSLGVRVCDRRGWLWDMRDEYESVTWLVGWGMDVWMYERWMAGSGWMGPSCVWRMYWLIVIWLKEA